MVKKTYVFSVPLGPVFTPRLRMTLASLRAQTIQNDVVVKIALCDVSNSDEAKALAEEYSDLIVYRRHGPDEGQSAAINEGWAAIPDGDIYSWLNADDYLLPDALRKVDAIFRAEPDTDIVYGQSLIFDEDDALTGLHPEVTDHVDDLPRSNRVSQPSCFYTKSALDEVGHLNVDLHYVMDWDLWLRFYTAGKTFAYTPDILSAVLWEKGTKTSSWNNARMSEIRSLLARSDKPYNTFKSMIGFTLHHLSEYSIFAPIAKRLIGKQLSPLRFWRAVGDGREEVHIPVPIFDHIEIESCAMEFDVAVKGTAKFTGGDLVTFNGRTGTLSLKTHAFETYSDGFHCIEVLLSQNAATRLKLIAPK